MGYKAFAVSAFTLFEAQRPTSPVARAERGSRRGGDVGWNASLSDKTARPQPSEHSILYPTCFGGCWCPPCSSMHKLLLPIYDVVALALLLRPCHPRPIYGCDHLLAKTCRIRNSSLRKAKQVVARPNHRYGFSFLQLYDKLGKASRCTC